MIIEASQFQLVVERKRSSCLNLRSRIFSTLRLVLSWCFEPSTTRFNLAKIVKTAQLEWILGIVTAVINHDDGAKIDPLPWNPGGGLSSNDIPHNKR